MTTLLYIVLGLIILVIILTLIVSKSYEVNRSIIIKKSLPKVFSYLKLIKNQDNWSPWAAKDPTMEKSFIGIDGKVGCISTWKGNKEVVEGEQKITHILEAK